MKKSTLDKAKEWFVVNIISTIRWKPKNVLSNSQLDEIRAALTNDYFVIATRREHFLSAFFINLGHFLLTMRWGYFTHVMMNLEDEVASKADFRIIEATTHGTQYTPFDVAFSGVQSVALLKPVSMSLEAWTLCLDEAKTHLGKPYDNLLNMKNDLEINCVELVTLALKALPDYKTRFAGFDKLITKHKNITPQMFLECGDFHIVSVFKA